MIYIIFVLSNFFVSVNCNDFFVAKQYGDPNYYCVTNSPYAFTWVPNDKEESHEAAEQVSTFIPKRNQSNSFNQDINENDAKTKLLLQNHKNWSLKKSLNSDLNDVILDRRWEDMTMYETRPDRQPLEILDNLKKDFHIPISIRTEGDAQIFLCNGPSIFESECYEFRLQYTDTKQKSAIIKHVYNYQHVLYVFNYVAPFEKNKNTYIYTTKNHLLRYLSVSTWTHFMLKKTNNFLSLQQLAYVKNSLNLSITDKESELIKVTHMIIQSKRRAFWKIHELEYFYTEKSNEVLKLDSIIDVVDGSICISMFLWMCESCKLNLKLHTPKDPFYVIGEKQYKEEEYGWREIKFIVENIQVEQVVLTVTTSGLNGKVFWSIDEIRLCQREEYRMIQTNVPISNCTLITNEKNYIIPHIKLLENKDDEAIYPPSAEKKCSEKTISGLCVPCTWLPFQNCLRIKICENYKSDKVKCFCSAGYQNKGECTNECDNGTFGHGCKQKCGKCLHRGCNIDDGKCTNCIENYSGEKCDIPPQTTFAKAPQIKNISYTEVTIQMINVAIINENFDDPPSGYLIQYKKNHNSNEWLNINKKCKLKDDVPIKINNLEIDTQYIVTAIVVSVSGHEYTKGSIKTLNFTTKCDDFSDKSFETIPSNRSVKVLLKITKQTCKINRGRIILLDSEKNQLKNSTIFKNNTSISFEHLTPYTKYVIVIVINSKEYRKEFQTIYGVRVPSQVRNLTITNLSPKSVTLKWEAPLAMNGKFKHYRFEYEHLSYRGCGSNSTFKSNKISKITKSSSLTVDNLIPYSDYSLSVYASNDKFEGLPYTLNHSTPPLDLIQIEEVPQLINSWTGVRNISLEFSKINCTKIKGILLIKITAKCCDEWYKNTTIMKSFNYNSTTTEISLSNLVPFSKYNLTVELCRNKTFCSDFEIKKSLQTKAPTPLIDLSIYSKDESSVSVRWKSPHPTTSELAEYLIKYFPFNSTQKKIYLKSSALSCKLWPDLYCYKLSNLTSYLTYRIMIQVRNQNLRDYGQSKELEFETKKEQSDAPYDLNLEWTLNNDLILQWKHPNVTNGDVQRFDIIIFEVNTEKIRRELKVNKDNYTLEYNFKVEAIVFQPSTSYLIEISAYNGYSGKSINKTDTSPPTIPSMLYSKPKFSSTDNTIHFEISLNETKVLQINNYTLFLLISGRSINLEPLDLRLEKLAKISNLTNFTFLYECSLLDLNSSYFFTIGVGIEVKNCNNIIKNVKLDPSTFYNITIIFTNHFVNKTSYKIYSFNIRTKDDISKSQKQTAMSLLAVLSLLLIPTGIVVYVKHNSIENILRSGDNLENQQEALPLAGGQENLIGTQNQNSSTRIASEEHEYEYSSTHPLSNRPQIINNKSNPEDKSKNTEDHNKTKTTKCSKELVKNKLESASNKFVPTAEFKDYVEKCLKTGEFKQQYDMVFGYPIEPTYQSIEEKQYFGYIDVNINGEEILKAYIASEIPKPEDIADFWKMVWDDHVEHIILLDACGKKINKNYWPENNETIVCHNIQIQHIFTKISEHYDLRMFTLNYGEEIRNVDHLLLRTYNDFDFPTYSEHFVPFFQKILRWPLIPNSPILVHCNDGIEGTGFVILCDMCLRISKKKNEVDVFKSLQKLCDYNNKIINYDYYKLVHLVILEYYFDSVSIEDLTILYENV